jgi:hypothetical protein
MAAPVSNGVLRTNLADMKIGDYIKWQYNDGADNMTLGTFSDTISLGEMALGTAMSDFCDGTTSFAPKSGFFYFIKVAPGMVIADRKVKIISKAKLNASNMLKGNTYRCLTADEYKKYLIGSDLNGNIKPNDTNVFHHDYSPMLEQLQTGMWNDYDSNPYYIDVPASAYVSNGQDGNLQWMLTGGCVYRVIAYRPVMEYIDNKKSTNIYY